MLSFRSSSLLALLCCSLGAAPTMDQTLDAISAYAKTLPEKPDDPVSNAHLGRFTCFAKDDWERGLPMLAKGSDVGLRGLAE